MPVDLREMFLNLQTELAAKLQTDRAVIEHAPTKGDATELKWREMLNDYLPQRYRVSKAFVVDCEGNNSEQIDLVIYDRQYSPLLFKRNGALFVPAESVYAVFETKQELDKANIEYAQKKAASVRGLKRTSAPIPHAGGKYEPKDPPRILAGIVALESSWKPLIGDPLAACLKAGLADGRIDLGCALKRGSFEATYDRNGGVKIEPADGETALIFFVLRLLARLQEMGTVPAIDLKAYGRKL
jgi:hypothetical protein